MELDKEEGLEHDNKGITRAENKAEKAPKKTRTLASATLRLCQPTELTMLKRIHGMDGESRVLRGEEPESSGGLRYFFGSRPQPTVEHTVSSVESCFSLLKARNSWLMASPEIDDPITLTKRRVLFATRRATLRSPPTKRLYSLVCFSYI